MCVYNSFTGLDTLWDINATEDGQLVLNYDVESSKGSYKIVLVNYEEQSITTIAETEGKDEVTYELKKGKYTLKHLGIKAKGKFSMELEASSDIKVRYAYD